MVIVAADYLSLCALFKVSVLLVVLCKVFEPCQANVGRLVERKGLFMVEFCGDLGVVAVIVHVSPVGDDGLDLGPQVCCLVAQRGPCKVPCHSVDGLVQQFEVLNKKNHLSVRVVMYVCVCAVMVVVMMMMVYRFISDEL